MWELQIPAEFQYETVFYAGNGTNAAMAEWGRAMRRRYGKDDSFRHSDFSINYVGYVILGTLSCYFILF